VTASRTDLATRLAAYDRLLEVGVGHRPEVAAALVDAGASVTAIDVVDATVPDGVAFVRDDVVARRDAIRAGEDPPAHYRVDAVYGLNLPAELQRPARDVARAVDADFLFTTLGFEEPTIPVERESVGRETLYLARAGPSERR
jgi:uncharacterized UPF0146 family protein